MPTDTVPVWAPKRLPEPTPDAWACARDLAKVSSWAAQDVEALAYIIQSAHAAGEEKGRREMRDAVVADLRARAAHAAEQELASNNEGFAIGSAIVRLLCARLAEEYATLPTTPPTPNPLPATGGEERE